MTEHIPPSIPAKLRVLLAELVVVLISEARPSDYTTYRSYERALMRIAKKLWSLHREHWPDNKGWFEWSNWGEEISDLIPPGYGGAVESAMIALGRKKTPGIGIGIGYRSGGREIQQMIQQDLLRVSTLLRYIVLHSKESGANFDTVKNRVTMWALRWKEIKSLAMAFGAKEMGKEGKHLIWIMGKTEKHCEDCFGYSGLVFEARDWAAAGALPQSRKLACHGYRCRCRLAPTSKPLTPGLPSPPKYAGLMSGGR